MLQGSPAVCADCAVETQLGLSEGWRLYSAVAESEQLEICWEF